MKKREYGLLQRREKVEKDLISLNKIVISFKIYFSDHLFEELIIIRKPQL